MWWGASLQKSLLIEDKTVVSKRKQAGNNHLKNLKDLF